NYVASKSCLVCGRQPSEPHHVRFAQKLAFGRKVSDEFTVPLCRLHHRELHRSRNEPLWWKTARIDPLPIPGEPGPATRPRAARPPGSGAWVQARSVFPTDKMQKESAAKKCQSAGAESTRPCPRGAKWGQPARTR